MLEVNLSYCGYALKEVTNYAFACGKEFSEDIFYE